MNNIIKILFLIVIFFLNGCKEPKVEQKIDPNLKAELIRLKKTSQLTRQITILFKVNEELTDLHYLILKKKGVKISANIGNIYTATIPAKSIYDLAKMRFIDYVQGQKRLKAHSPL